MSDPMTEPLARRSFLRLAAGAGSLALAACTGSGAQGTTHRGPSSTSPSAPAVQPVDCARAVDATSASAPLWTQAIQRGLVYGSSTATWQISDAAYAKLYARESAILFTEDDLLWYRLRPSPTSGLDYSYGDEIVAFAEDHGILMFGAHLVWDEGFGDGWSYDDLWGLHQDDARTLLFDTIDGVVRRYRGRMAGWIVANEVLDEFGERTDVPWYATIGPGYVEDAFHATHEIDPEALLVLNDYGYETDADGSAADKRQVTLDYLDGLLANDVPVQALGVQAHLHADGFADAFDAAAYRAFLGEVASRGLAILITEMDVLDDGLPKDVVERDQAVADVYRRYLDAALEEPAVGSLMTFGLSDRYTWLEEDYPREDGAPRRPLPFDEDLEPKPAYRALANALEEAPPRNALWVPPRC